MDRQLAERMVGAACLLAVLVLVVPTILDGNPDSGATITHPEVEEELDLRTHTIRLDGPERTPPVPTPVQVAEEPGPGSSIPVAPAPVIAEAPPTALPEPAEPSEPEPATTTPPAPSTPAPGAPPPRSAAPAGNGDWIVQLGSFSSRANADRLAADVRAKGFGVTVDGGGGTSGNLFRVRAGPAPDKEGATELSSRLAAAGFKGGRVGRR
ncbi:MAG: SPOR domain-containing protein [Gammaproteobacteria bacterium]|nr:SPOR domain-containing protein [Gammaproteobacteria bacterium]